MIVLDIAGVLFSISGRNCSVIFNDEPAYKTFIRQERDEIADISIDVVVGGLPDISAAKRVFDSESSWFLSSLGEYRYLVLDPPSIDGGPLWIARFRPSIETVTIFCDEQLATWKDGNCFIDNPIRYPLDQVLLMLYLAEKGGSILHAAGIAIHGKGYIFPGRSGAGKSTLSRFFKASPTARLLSDDRVVARISGRNISVYGTPWPGEEGVAENACVPLSGIFFLSHGKQNAVKEITGRDALERLMPIISIPWFDKKSLLSSLSLCEDLVLNIPSYELTFKPGREVAEFLGKFLSKA